MKEKDWIYQKNNGLELILNKYKNGVLEAVPLEDVQLNIDYALVISTNGGLWRYLIGDVVRFTSLSPFRIKLIGRTKSFLNAFGEELVVENTDSALLAACSKYNASVKDYTVAPIYIDAKSGRHQSTLRSLVTQ